MTHGAIGLVAASMFVPAIGCSREQAPEMVVRQGYALTVAVDRLDGARFMAVDDQGVLYVTRPSEGDIVALRDEDGDGAFEKRETFIRGKDTVHGIQCVDGWVWFTTTASVERARDTNGDSRADEVEEVLGEGDIYTGGGGHWWRSLLVTDEFIYTSVGDAGNITDDQETERKKIWRFQRDGSGKTLFSSGIRNTEKLRLRPGTSEVWGFDHGSDWYGGQYGDRRGSQPITDQWPPEELNHYVEGGFYGHPFLVGPRVPRAEFANRSDLNDLAKRTRPPELNLPAHWAINGWTFIDPAVRRAGGNGLPAEFDGDIVFASHGSWNSSVPVGYCFSRVIFVDGKPCGHYWLVKGVTEEGRVTGRPVDVVQTKDGSLLLSIDAPRGAIYRLRWAGAANEVGEGR